MLLRSESFVSEFIFLSSSNISPFPSGSSYSLLIKEIIVLFPDPESPTKEVIVFGLISKLISSKTCSLS